MPGRSGSRIRRDRLRRGRGECRAHRADAGVGVGVGVPADTAAGWSASVFAMPGLLNGLAMVLA